MAVELGTDRGVLRGQRDGGRPAPGNLEQKEEHTGGHEGRGGETDVGVGPRRGGGVLGVSAAKARITRSGATVRAETSGSETGPLRDELRVEAARALDELQLAKPLPVKVNVQSKGRAA